MKIQQKAIEQLERVSRHLATIGEKEDYTDIAIQALEQECEDAVSRQAVLDIVKFEENWLFDAKSNNADTDIAFSGIRTQVAKLSSVTKALEPCEDCISRKALLDKAWDVPYYGKYIQVVDVGDIEELPSVTPAHKQEPCEDAISRREVKELFQEGSVMGMYDFLGIDELPPVTPARHKGHWIDHSDEGYVECSECGSCTNCDGNINNLHFCFSCGAEMESEE